MDPAPGLLVLWSGSEPRLAAVRMPAGGLVIGRESLDLWLGETTDDRISRQHLRATWRDGRFHVVDLGSRNGSYVDGHALVDREMFAMPGAVVRTGRTVSLLVANIRPFDGAAIVIRDELVVGPSTRMVWRSLDALAATDASVLVVGEAGTGRHAMAGAFARATGAVVLRHADRMPVETLAASLTNPKARVVATSARRIEGIPPLAVVDVPPLRARPDELAMMIRRAVGPDLRLHATVVEAAIRRSWSGNLVELFHAVASAVQLLGMAGRKELRGDDLFQRKIDPRLCMYGVPPRPGRGR
jgi:hypothetical protein